MSNFRIYIDGIFYGITKTDAEPDDLEVFATFGRAKTALLVVLRNHRDQYAQSVRDASRLTLADVEEVHDEEAYE